MMLRFILYIGLLVGSLSPAVAQSRIDQLGAAAAIGATDKFPICQGCNASTAALAATGTQLQTFITANSPAGANPTATAGAAAINGVATTFMRSDGAPALAKASNSVFGIVEVDNTTITSAAGVISTVNNGTVTSIATGCGSAGGTITTTGTIIAAEIVNAQTGTTYTVANGDCGKLVTYSNVSAIAVTLPQAGAGGNFTSGWYSDHSTVNTGTVTITPTTSTINGAATLTIIKGQSYRVVSDGTNYQVIGSGTFGTTGSGNLAYATSPTFVTPVLGIPTSVTLNNTSDIIGGVTMTLGSDATGDMYYRNSSGVLTRLAVCTGTNVIGASGGLPACVAQSGGGSPGGANTQLQYNNSSAFGGVSGWTTNGTNTLTNTQSIAAVSTDGLILTNTTAAAAGAQQWSPRLHFTGQGWKTNATAASQSTDWIVEDQPVQGAANPTSNLVTSASINGGAYSAAWTIGSGGAATLAGALTIGGNILTFNSSPQYITVGGVSLGWGFSTANSGAPMFAVWGATNSSFGLGSSAGAVDILLSRIAAASLQFGAIDAAAPVAQITQVQRVVAGTSNTAGALWTFKDSAGTGTGVSGGYSFQVAPAGSTGTAQNTFSAAMTIAGGTGAIGMPLLASSSAAQTGTVCWSSGAGNLTVDTTVGCLTSLEEAKIILADIAPESALEIVSQLVPFSFRYKRGWGDSGQYEQFGLGAHQVASIDERLVGRDPSGSLQGVRYQELTAVLVAAIQKQQAQINELKRAR